MPYVIYGFTLVYLFFKGDTTNILHASPVTSSLTEESTDRPSAPMTSITDSNSIQLLCQKDAKSFLSLHDREWKVFLNKKASWAFSKSSCKYLRPTTIQNQQKGAIWVWVHTQKFNTIKQSRPKTPHSFGEQTVSQDTFAPLASSELLSRERWYKSFLVFSKHSFASGTNCRPKIDRTCRRLFKSPAKYSCFAVQEVTRDLILSTKGW